MNAIEKQTWSELGLETFPDHITGKSLVLKAKNSSKDSAQFLLQLGRIEKSKVGDIVQVGSRSYQRIETPNIERVPFAVSRFV